MSQYKDHGKLKWVVFFCADFPGQLIKHIFLSPNQLLAQLVLGEISIYLRGQQWVLILLVPPCYQIGIKSRHLRDPLVVASFTASSRDLRGRKFWESCKFRKFPRSTLERGVIRFMKTSHSHSMSQQYESEMFSYFLTLCSCTWAVNWLKIGVNRGMQSMVW